MNDLGFLENFEVLSGDNSFLGLNEFGLRRIKFFDFFKIHYDYIIILMLRVQTIVDSFSVIGGLLEHVYPGDQR